MNKRKLLNLANFIEELPRNRFDMGTFSDDAITPKTSATCGTACCIGGWAIVRSGYRMTEDGEVFGKGLQYADPHNVAKEILELTDSEADDLFYTGNWPRKDGKDTWSRPIFAETNKGAAKRIRHFVETGK